SGSGDTRIRTEPLDAVSLGRLAVCAELYLSTTFSAGLDRLCTTVDGGRKKQFPTRLFLRPDLWARVFFPRGQLDHRLRSNSEGLRKTRILSGGLHILALQCTAPGD